MTRSRSPDPRLISGAVLLGLLGALSSFWLASALATPRHLKARTNAIEAIAARAQSVARTPRDTSVYLAHALCRSAPSEAGEVVRSEIVAAAQRSGVGSPQVTLNAPDEFQVGSNTFPVIFSIEVTSRYDLVLAFLDRLAGAEPQLFADTLDLTSRTSAVSLKLTGRVLCLNS